MAGRPGGPEFLLEIPTSPRKSYTRKGRRPSSRNLLPNFGPFRGGWRGVRVSLKMGRHRVSAHWYDAADTAYVPPIPRCAASAVVILSSGAGQVRDSTWAADVRAGSARAAGPRTGDLSKGRAPRRAPGPPTPRRPPPWPAPRMGPGPEGGSRIRGTPKESRPVTS